jgi:hypothetical protein
MLGARTWIHFYFFETCTWRVRVQFTFYHHYFPVRVENKFWDAGNSKIFISKCLSKKGFSSYAKEVRMFLLTVSWERKGFWIK